MKDKIIELLKDVTSKGFFHFFSANTLIYFIEFASQLLVAGILIADDIGRIKSFQVYASIAIIIAGLGFNTSVLKLCSEKNSPSEKQNLFTSAFIYTLLTSGITLILFIVIAKLNLLSVDSKTNSLFVYYAFTIPVIALNNLLIAYFQALKEFKKVSTYLVIARFFHVAVIIGLTYFYKIEGFILGVVLGFLFSLILLLIKTNTRIRLNGATKESFKRHWSVAKYGLSVNVVSAINLYLDFIILNRFVDDSYLLGQYGFALTLMTGLRVFGSTVQQFVTPYYSENALDFLKLKKMFKRSERLFILISLIVTVLAVLILPTLVHFLYSGNYDDGMSFFIYLSIAWFIRSWYALKGPFLFSLGFMKVNFYNSLLLLMLSIVPCWFLIKEYELIGASLGQCLVAILGAIIVWVSVRKANSKHSDI